MDSVEDESPQADAKAATFTPADRIVELNEIDKVRVAILSFTSLLTQPKSVASLLHSASGAIQILANSPTNSPPSLEAQKTAFTEHTSTYFSTLSAIEVRLRRQVYALEEAGLIAPGNERDAKRGRAAGSDEREVVAGGSLDVSWLNARAKDAVGLQMEKELWSRARALVEELQRKDGEASHEPEVKDETMGEDNVSNV